MSTTSSADRATQAPPGRARRARTALTGMANWRFLLVSVVVNALVLTLVIVILPGLRFEPTKPFAAALLLSVLYGLVRAYVKPVVQFLTLKYLFATYGLITILINAFLLWVVAFLSLDTLVYSSYFALLIGGGLAGLFSLILESVFGLTPPVLDRTDEQEASA